MKSTSDDYRFSKAGDSALNELYSAVGSETTEQKINILQKELGEIQVYAAGGYGDDCVKLACLEYEWLAAKGLVALEFA
jgi:hypothetical protein